MARPRASSFPETTYESPRSYVGVTSSVGENKVSPEFAEGPNDKTSVIQCHACGLRDKESLRFKTLTSLLPAI